ncbi:MAG: phosphoribosylglycinamide formyltransferase [Clostridiales Family XIII bacterium]|nr:phosphoribosylglycinamide formyltransferase [Clostridiales Family XIII bacterium]
MYNISVLVSGGGTNLQAIIDTINDGTIKNARIGLIISSNPKAYALERADREGIHTSVIRKKDFKNDEARGEAMARELAGAKTDLIVLAGYMNIVPEKVVNEYEGRIMNIHPALLPKFGGLGFYGLNVHKAVLAAGEKESGATVHFVDNGVDTGAVIKQGKVPVLAGDSPEQLADRVLEVEHKILVEAIVEWIASLRSQ